MMASLLIPNNILNDLCARFIINLPEKESQDVIRVFFQVELAHWFYLDFYWTDSLGKACSLKEFAYQIFSYCPSLTKFKEDFDQAFESWKSYKQSVPTYGAILIDPGLQFCLLLQGYWIKSSWGFPKGKVNQDEAPIDCAIREVLEETGYDITNMVDPSNYLEYHFNEQVCRLYIVPGVSMDTKFQARTRQEIKEYAWFRVDFLPTHKKDNTCRVHYNMNANAFFMVIPFMKELKARIQQMEAHKGHHPLKTYPNEPSQTLEQWTGTSEGETNDDFIKKLLEPADKKGKGRDGKKNLGLNLGNLKDETKQNGLQANLTSLDESNGPSSAPYEDTQNSTGDNDAISIKSFDFLSPAWSNFKLNTGELLNAMCSF